MEHYELAQFSWNDEQTITISSMSGSLIAVFPLTFVASGGINSWDFIREVLHELIVVQAEGIFLKEDGQPIDFDHHPCAGKYIYKANETVIFSRGPEYFRKNAPAKAGEASSTRSNSKRSTENQSRFRTSLIARDFNCLVSEADYDDCTACHIIPQSRPDVYQHILSISYPPPLFRPSAGLLLSDSLHHAFDRLELSFFVKGEEYYVHFFVAPSGSDRRRWHGKKLDGNRFRGRMDDRPDPRYIRWHYSQCVKARIRGFSVGMGVPETSAQAVEM